MNTKHSPGPWHSYKANTGELRDRAIYAEGQSTFDLAKVFDGGSTEQMEANANLISAAPDLLAACRTLMTAPWCSCNDCRNAKAKGLAAIAKAEGTQL